MKKLHTVWLKGTLVFVVAHLLTLIFLSIKTRSLEPFNIFYILDLHLLFPISTKGTISTILSIVIVLTVFGYFYITYPKKK